MVAAEQDVGEGLVVPEQHVVVRLEALDHVALQEESLHLAVGHRDLEGGGRRHHALEAHRQLAGVEIAGDALFQALRLADIERFAGAIRHAVDAGARRHGLERAAQHRNTALERLRLCGDGRRILGDGRGGPFDLDLHAPESRRCASPAPEIDPHRAPVNEVSSFRTFETLWFLLLSGCQGIRPVFVRQGPGWV